MVYGVGDGGAGPGEEHIERLHAYAILMAYLMLISAVLISFHSRRRLSRILAHYFG